MPLTTQTCWPKFRAIYVDDDEDYEEVSERSNSFGNEQNTVVCILLSTNRADMVGGWIWWMRMVQSGGAEAEAASADMRLYFARGYSLCT